MFGVDSVELLIVAVLALLFIGPKDLPQVMLKVGRWVGKVRGYARHFTAGVEQMMREAELDEMEKRWRLENERIMSVHPTDGHYPDPPAASPADFDQPALPLESPAAPDDDPRPPAERELP